MIKRAAIITEEKYVDPVKTDWYIQQVLTEDGLLAESFENKGVECIKVDWADPDFDWGSVDAAIFRSTWNYFHRYDEFQNWLTNVDGKTQFINPISQIQWNMDKHYLIDLDQRGVPIVETEFLEAGTTETLKEIHKRLNWSKTVLKPCVSGAGRHTYLLELDNLEEYEMVFQEVVSNESMMLQPFQENIVTKGEVSHIVIGGKHTHSVLKKAKEGDYRVQDDFGGTVHDYKPSEEEIAFAENVAKSCDPLPYYARIDVIWNNNNELVISELELIEPELWFRNNPQAAQLLADYIIRTH